MATKITNDLVFRNLPRRAPESHKGSYGKVLALCGCSKYRGAAALCVCGALRAGAGLVTLAAEESVISAVAQRVMEPVYLPLPDEDGLSLAASKSTVCVAGCGKEATPATAQEMKTALGASSGTVVLDAGGLCSLADDKLFLMGLSGRLIVTPHPGEMARLTGRSVREIEADRGATALSFARESGAVTVLKGHRTLVATPWGELYENGTGNAGLARGGSGDILAGIIAGLAAQGLEPWQAAVCGVYLHGLAADWCARRLSMQGMLPSDILADLCAIFLENNR
ncbi:NAD(P)H-hydrate dehydratase [Ruthenibacterium sp. CLA-JM-H11]|uniref:ADP-dependent (S)-NAD(P)H-hydrate dehydratase n=1 Tax=Ruthenibacterium intestinale TaxID=3133163 RepID=A0ABV1GBB4_9FIRM